MKTLKALCLCALWTLFVIASCGKQPGPDPVSDPSVTINTPATIDIACDVTSATISFVANRDWTVSSTEGWCTVSPSSGKTGESAATITVTLEPNETYEPRTATITIKADGVEKSVTVTQAAAEKLFITNLQAVDLGLSVNWADRNLGADSPSGYGNYYAWGETETKDNYSWNNYKWAQGSKTSLTKYNTRSAYGNVDEIVQLELEDDAAWVNTGGEWRMPTDAEMTEMRDNCTRKWETIDGVSGCRFTSNINGASIFIPAAGGFIGNAAMSVNEHGNVVTSTICYENNGYGYKDDYVWYLYFDSYQIYRYGDSRASGWAIRPVKYKQQK